MRIAELLNSIASWLESPNNEALLLAESVEGNEKCMKIVAESCTLAAALIKNAAEEVDLIEAPEESKITIEAVEELANLASAFDASGDINLKKQASVIDELLLTIASPPRALAAKKEADDYRLEELKKKYNQPREDLKVSNKISESEKAIEKSKMTEHYNILEAPLSARSCPDHPGAQIARVGEHMWQCELDHKIYNFETGFTLNNGKKVPGGDVSLQTQNLNPVSQSIFDSREDRLLSNKP